MCGIAGFVDKTKDRQALDKMTCALARRGPDDSGLYFNDGVGLGHRRLSIIDLSSAGHQPMRFEELVIVFNGEIYNYKEVQQQLSEEGYQFSSSSDTEVVIKAFHCWGLDCVTKFIGMFAFAIYNEKQKALHLVRDRAGVKPLYYYHKNGRLAFASELKSFRHFLTNQEKANINTTALSEFLSVGYISSGHSILADVKKLPQAHALTFINGKLEIKRYWQVSFRENKDWFGRTDNDVLDELEALATSAFKYRMVADVPVGVFLSAGVDSSLVTAILSKHYGQLRTFTIGFNEKEFDESADARRIAAQLNTVHTEGVLNEAKAGEILSQFYTIYDEPHGDNSCVPTTYVSELAKEAGVKVVLSADAGDELFGGYKRYTEYIQRWSQVKKMGPARLPAKMFFKTMAMASPVAYAERMNRFGDILAKGDFIEFYQTIIRSSSVNELQAIFPKYGEPLTASSNDTILNQMCQWDFDRYMTDDILVKVDRSTMYHSIEGREPFLDHRLIEFAAQLPGHFKIRNGETKYILKKLLERYLPHELCYLPKRGFGAPLQLWIKNHYRDTFTKVLSQSNGYFNTAEMTRLLRDYNNGSTINYSLLWYLFSFQAWYKQWNAA